MAFVATSVMIKVINALLIKMVTAVMQAEAKDGVEVG